MAHSHTRAPSPQPGATADSTHHVCGTNRHPQLNMMTLFAIDDVGARFAGDAGFGIVGPRLHIVSPVAPIARSRRLAFSGWFKSSAPISPRVREDNIASAKRRLEHRATRTQCTAARRAPSFPLVGALLIF